MKTAEERGPFGAWTTSERDRRGWSIEQLVKELEKIDEPFSDSYLRGIEAGRRPSARVRLALTAVFGSEPPTEQPVPTLDMLIAAMASQTEAINRLVERLDLEREAREGIALGKKRAAKKLAPAPRPGESPARSQRRQPRGTRHESPVTAAGR